VTLDENLAAAPPTTFDSSIQRTVLTLLGSVVFIAAGIWMLMVHSSVKTTIVGAVAVLFFGACAILFAARLIRRKPELVISSEGFAHLTYGTIAWSQVDHVAIRQIKVRTTSQRMIAVVLHDPAGYLAAAPRLARISGSANMQMGYSPVNISAVTLPVSLDVVLETMRRHNPQLAVLS